MKDLSYLPHNYEPLKIVTSQDEFAAVSVVKKDGNPYYAAVYPREAPVSPDIFDTLVTKVAKLYDREQDFMLNHKSYIEIINKLNLTDQEQIAANAILLDFKNEKTAEKNLYIETSQRGPEDAAVVHQDYWTKKIKEEDKNQSHFIIAYNVSGTACYRLKDVSYTDVHKYVGRENTHPWVMDLFDCLKVRVATEDMACSGFPHQRVCTPKKNGTIQPRAVMKGYST